MNAIDAGIVDGSDTMKICAPINGMATTMEEEPDRHRSRIRQ